MSPRVRSTRGRVWTNKAMVICTGAYAQLKVVKDQTCAIYWVPSKSKSITKYLHIRKEINHVQSQDKLEKRPHQKDTSKIHQKDTRKINSKENKVKLKRYTSHLYIFSGVKISHQDPIGCIKFGFNSSYINFKEAPLIQSC